MIIDREKRLFGVDTPRTAGFFAEYGECTAGPLTVKLDGNAPAAVWVSALDDSPIASSGRLLLTHVADVQDEGTVYADDSKKILLKWGQLPHMMRRSVADVTLAFADAKSCKVYALAADGTRRGEVSMCNDDNCDNRFYEPLGRFPTIEEDEPPYRLLCNEYPPAKD